MVKADISNVVRDSFCKKDLKFLKLLEEKAKKLEIQEKISKVIANINCKKLYMLKAFQSMKNDHYTAKDFNGFIKKFEYSLNYPECAPQNDNHQVTLAGNDAKDQNSLDECDY